MKKKTLTLLLLLCAIGSMAASRWDIAGHHAVQWNNLRGGVPHEDHIEMSGEKISVVYYWKVDQGGQFSVDRHLVFPMLRTIPDNTHASWMPRTGIDFLTGMRVDGEQMHSDKVEQVLLDGALTVKSKIKGDDTWFELTRCFFPSTTKAAALESYTLKNTGEHEKTLVLPGMRHEEKTHPESGTRGSYILSSSIQNGEPFKVTLAPGKSITVKL